MDKYVLGFYISENKEYVVLIRKNRPGWQKGKYNGVGGKIEINELPLAAMEREFREETNNTENINWEHFAVLNVHNNYTDCIVYCYRAFGNIAECKTVTDEQIKYMLTGYFDYNRVPTLDYLIPLAINNHYETPIEIYINKDL